MIKAKLLTAAFCGFALTACEQTQEYRELLDASEFADQVVDLDALELRDFNTKLSFLYLGMADLAAHTNHITNASLIGIAAAVARGSLGGAPGTLEAKRILTGLVITETARYAAPNEVARGLRIAGQQSACIAKTIDQAEVADRSKTLILTAMQRSRSNLHERMIKRQPVNITSLVANFKSETAVLREDNIQLENALAGANAEAGSFEAKLLACLQPSAS